MIEVVIHEVGHNFMPMIINNDERQWSWMDEGLNTFVQYLTQELWDNKYATSRGPAYKIVDYMKMPKDQLEPIMTNSENIINFGANAYSKPATGLNILRETIMGRNLFDYAFKEFSRRWAFKHPEPADFFRTMEDASGVDLDWFWRGWFYSIEPCDIALDSVKIFKADPNTIAKERPDTQNIAKAILNDFDDISKIRNRDDKTIEFFTDADKTTRDFYYDYDRGLKKIDTTPVITIKKSEPLDKEAFKAFENQFYYQLSFTNKGGLVMPLIIEFTYKDGSKEIERIAAEIWRKDEARVTKVFVKSKEVASILLDPYRETADINTQNNSWPTMEMPTNFQLFKASGGARRRPVAGAVNPMQREIK